MSYKVYPVGYTAMAGPEHPAIVIETHETKPKTGHIYHFIGNIQAGMKSEDRPVNLPKE